MKLQPDDIGSAAYEVDVSDYNASTRDGKTTLDLLKDTMLFQWIPKGSAFGWNYNLNSWIYKIETKGNPVRYVSKPLCSVGPTGIWTTERARTRIISIW